MKYNQVCRNLNGLRVYTTCSLHTTERTALPWEAKAFIAGERLGHWFVTRNIQNYYRKTRGVNLLQGTNKIIL